MLLGSRLFEVGRLFEGGAHVNASILQILVYITTYRQRLQLKLSIGLHGEALQRVFSYILILPRDKEYTHLKTNFPRKIGKIEYPSNI